MGMLKAGNPRYVVNGVKKCADQSDVPVELVLFGFCCRSLPLIAWAGQSLMLL